MDEKEISVLIVDDSALMRNLIGRIIEEEPGLSVAGKAINGNFALQKLSSLKPDIIVLDLEMPEMNGIEFLQARREKGIDIPVIILSSMAKKGAKITMDALSLGASDFILKPSGSISPDIRAVSGQLTEMIKAYGGKYHSQKESEAVEPKAALSPGEPHADALKQDKGPGSGRVMEADRKGEPLAIIAIGISTGGPNALREIFPRLDRDLPLPILVVQHMPPGFTEEFARSLDRICPLEVSEAKDGDIIRPGRILIAPGSFHLEVEKRPLASVVRLSSAEPENGHRPSVDVLFASVARHYGGRAMAVIMTGMGRDGAREIGTINSLGGLTLAQDEQSSVVFGMPKAAIAQGFIQHVVSLDRMAETINRFVRINSP
ncbi:MAG: chemotaxis response regulator protein-glutamate methylesterase [Spirochaetales bacterium]|nr:MAG: chemotaxis response regulator protein-glutamate methylesterase [Spirochaetales bacterium]